MSVGFENICTRTMKNLITKQILIMLLDTNTCEARFITVLRTLPNEDLFFGIGLHQGKEVRYSRCSWFSRSFLESTIPLRMVYLM